MPQSLAKNLIHLVFSTKHRETTLTDSVRPSLHAYICTVLKNNQSPVVTLSKAVEELKKSSSKWLKTQSTPLSSFSWQAGYGAFSVSESNVPAVETYIAKQAEHHRKLSFQDELRALLTKHKMSFDEQYLWD